MGMPARKSEAGFTYADYLKWPAEERWELIDGQAYAMSPAPSNFHQLIVGELFRLIANYLHGKPCRPFVAPFDVRLPRAVPTISRSIRWCSPTSASSAIHNSSRTIAVASARRIG